MRTHRRSRKTTSHRSSCDHPLLMISTSSPGPGRRSQRSLARKGIQLLLKTSPLYPPDRSSGGMALLMLSKAVVPQVRCVLCHRPRKDARRSTPHLLHRRRMRLHRESQVPKRPSHLRLPGGSRSQFMDTAPRSLRLSAESRTEHLRRYPLPYCVHVLSEHSPVQVITRTLVVLHCLPRAAYVHDKVMMPS